MTSWAQTKLFSIKVFVISKPDHSTLALARPYFYNHHSFFFQDSFVFF